MSSLEEHAKKLIAHAYYENMEIKELLGYEKGVNDMLKRAKTEQSWANPYSEAISVLETASRSFEGGYG